MGHKPDNDVEISNFGLIRRPTMYERHHSSSSIHYVHGEHKSHTSHTSNHSHTTKHKNFKNRKNTVIETIVIEKLELSVTFRDNILYSFSYLLHGRENGLTEEQYTALQTIYEFLKKKVVYIYNLLPIISKLGTTDKNYQTKVILSSLTKNLPTYSHCAAKYLVHEIELGRIDLNTLLKPTAFDKFNYLANIDLNTISKSKIKNEELIGYDKHSNITQKALGPVFVKLFNNLQAKKLPLSQELFGLILINLPNPTDDSVLEENIRFLYDLLKNNVIDHKHWNLIKKDSSSKDVYTLVFSVLTKILKSNVQTIIKDAVVYVHHHLKPVTVPTYVNSDFKYMNHLIEKEIDIEMLLSPITPQDFDLDTVRMKNSLIMYFKHHPKNEDIIKILKGFNKYAFNEPFDLLLAFLTRIKNRVSNIKPQVLQQPATALLSSLIVKKYSSHFTPFVSSEIDILVLLESVKTPDANPEFQLTIDSVKSELIEHPQTCKLVNNLIPKEKSKCEVAKQCLMNTFHHVQKLQKDIPSTLTIKIQKIVYILKTTSHYQSQIFPTQHSIGPRPIDVNLYLTQQRPIAVAIETDKTYSNNMVSDLNGYVWNINKYENKFSPVVQDGESQVETLKWQLGIPTYIDSVETKMPSSISEMHPTTTDVTHVIEENIDEITDYVSIEENTDRPLIIRPVTTSKPRRKKRPHHTTSTTTTEGTVEESSSEIESTPDYIVPTKEDSNQASISEIEEQTPPPKKKIFSKVITHEPAKQHILQQQRIEQQLSSERVSSAVVLPPNIDTDQPLKVQLSNTGVPIITTDEEYNGTVGIVLPDVKDLLKSPNINDLMQNTKSPIVIQVLQPLHTIFGKNYVKKILKNVNVDIYPTNIALLLEIFKKAVTSPEVARIPSLKKLIYEYISAMEYACPTILFPIVASSKKLVSNVVYSTFNPNDLTHSTLAERPPDKLIVGSITVPLTNPKQLLQSINPFNPYGELLPTLEKGDAFEIKIRPLKMILTSEKIKEILPDIEPMAFQNQGALLITILHRLRESKVIQSNSNLKYLIDNYIQAIEIPSMTIQVSEDNLVKMMSETTGQWQPELTSLLSALPSAKNDAEFTMLEDLEEFLADPILLEKLHIKKPPLTMIRGDLLQEIILSVLSGTIRIDKQLLKTFKYYKNKIDFTDTGALPIMWMWVETFVFKAEIQLGSMIQKTVNFEQLSYKEKVAYNELITYLARNPNLLQDNKGFEIDKFETQGEFVDGVFQLLLTKPEVNKKIKKDIEVILPHVMKTGAGAVTMPNFSHFKNE